MKILICHNFYQQRGGEDNVVQQEIELLRNNGNIVETFFVHSDEVLHYSLLKKILFFHLTNQPIKICILIRLKN